jgi:3-dehydroquinate synthase
VVVIAHARGSYPVILEPGLLSRLPELAAEYLPGRRTALITDSTVGELYADFLSGTNPAWTARPRTCNDSELRGWRQRFEFPAGERLKTRDTWARLTDELLAGGYGRAAGIVALGGGVVGDLAGFVAATLARGVPYLQVPTTLLAMVDASIGGKTGVNTDAGKNLVGAFHPPAAVLVDPLTLGTLPDSELRGGLAEAVKHGLIADAAYFEWLDANAGKILSRDLDTLTRLVERSVELKASVVSADEEEQGSRATLNAGHTVAHALERASEYSLSHGAAVAVGLVAETALAERLGIARPGLSDGAHHALERFGLATRLKQPIGSAVVLGAMRGDKKNHGDSIRFALIRSVGRAHQEAGCWTSAAPEAEIVAALRTIGVE